MKKILCSLIALFAFNPMILAYSNYIYAGGESVGINLESNSILIMGTYIVHITMVITKQNKMIVKLTQELAIIKEKSEELINIKFRNFSVIPNFIDPDNFKFEKKDIE